MVRRKNVRKSQNPVSKKRKEEDKPESSTPKKSILNPIQAKTPGQQIYLDAIQNTPIIVCDGPAGCGKTFISFACALEAYLSQEVERIIIVRPTFTSSDEPELGFLPGSLDDKMAPFVAPLLRDSAPLLIRSRTGGDQRFVERFGNGKDNSNLLSQFNIEVVPLHLMRGRTFNSAFVILDEAQNCSMPDFKLFLTRIGKKSRVVIEGDSTQKDRENGDLPLLMRKLYGLDYVAVVKLDSDDIIRNPLIAGLIDRLDD